MFPIRDSVPKYSTPVVVYSLILLNTLVFLVQIITPDPNFIISQFALSPRYYFLADGSLRPGLSVLDYLPFVTATFLHGGWLHIIFNMWTLYIFGSTLESRLGGPQFLVFYLLCAFASTFAHGYFNADSYVPVIGASGAIAGVIGGYALRFPKARLTLLFPIVIVPIIFTVPALAYAVIWFVIQLLQTSWEAMRPSMGGGVAWWAHIGGFIAGVVLLPFFLLFAPSGRRTGNIQRGPWDKLH
jgi:membrane associated rhomboid family serine protease